jgi:hypothetical protein
MIDNTVTVGVSKYAAGCRVNDAIIIVGGPGDLFHLGSVIQQDNDIGWYVISSHREYTGIIGKTQITHKDKARYQ